MYLDLLNLNQLRVFECVYRTRSTTRAALELHLTQSGVSQHITGLESALGVPLFDRIRQRLVPTPAGNALYSYCAASLDSLEQAIAQIKDGDHRLTGTVRIGMPIEFGNNLVVPLLSEFGRKNPGVCFKLELGFASVMNDLLVNGDLDFAFVDEFRMDQRVTVDNIGDELLDLCISPKWFTSAVPPRSKQDRKFFESLEYVEYQDSEPLLRMWFGHHLKHRNLHLNVRATVMDVQGVARLILSGLGAGVLPGHLLKRLARDGQKLYRFEGSGTPLRNAISVAYLAERTHSGATRALIDFLKDSLKGANWE